MKNAKRQTVLTHFLNHVSYYIEVITSFVLLVSVIMLLGELVFNSGLFPFKANHLDFTDFLAQAFTLIIGVEFTKMLFRHTSETVVEVLLFATARQVVVSHSGGLETLIGVASIAGLFAVKKFLLPGEAAKQTLSKGDVSGED